MDDDGQHPPMDDPERPERAVRTGDSQPRTAAADMQLQPGTLVADRYRIGGLLGEGGMGAVYSAEHVRVGRPVALKVLASRWLGVEHVARRFRDEARAASAAGHPNIIEVFDAGELPDGRPFLVMELMEGRELYEEVRSRGRFELVHGCRICRDVARALDAAHARGIIHRDLKSENVMLVERGGQEIVKVLDFGIAADTMALGGRATAPGMIMGTPIYMAPEQAEGAPPTIAFDVYALGVLMHEVLTGTTPFASVDGLRVLHLKTSQPAASVAALADELPDDLVELIDSCLALEPTLRPATAREVADRLQAVIDRNRGATHGAGTEVLPPRRLRPAAATGRWRSIVSGVAVGLLSVALLIWALHDDSVASEPVVRAELPLAPLPRPELEPRPTALDEPLPPVPTDEPEPVVDDGRTPSEPEPSPLPEPPEPEPEPAAVAEPGERSSEPTPAAGGLCWRTRKQAKQAREAHDWKGILRRTRDAGCWTAQRDERRRLRAKAFMELGRWGDCVEASRGFRDPQGQLWHRTCLRRREQQG